jgi:ATPase subunit of ABC transporter with duplicated ATPase domains
MRTSRSRTRPAAASGRRCSRAPSCAIPTVLLLDEPTNHLDTQAIEWLETFLIERGTTLLFVTHDRAFLRRVATRIIELDRGRLV